jgi:hypothetical protein
MLENLTFTGRELLMAVVLATAVYLVEVLVFSRRRKSGQPPELRERISALEAELAAVKARLESVEARPPTESALDTQSTTHAEAVRMAREGVPVQEMADRLGISRSEAELITALHRAEP